MRGWHRFDYQDPDDCPNQMWYEEPDEAHLTRIDTEDEKTEREPYDDLTERTPPQ